MSLAAVGAPVHGEEEEGTGARGGVRMWCTAARWPSTEVEQCHRDGSVATADAVGGSYRKTA